MKKKVFRERYNKIEEPKVEKEIIEEKPKKKKVKNDDTNSNTNKHD